MSDGLSIALLGTSLTAGNSPDQAWSKYLASTLSVGDAREIIVNNLGIPASSSAIMLDNMQSALHSRADIATIEFAINDAYTPFGITTASSRANVLEMTSRLRQNNPNILIFLMIMNPCVPGTSHDQNRANYADYKQVYYELVAEDGDLNLIDCSDAWGVPTIDQLPDGIHPSIEAFLSVGLPVISEAIKETIA